MAQSSPDPKSDPIQLGFVPLIDAAPLIAAKELGFFEEAGLDIHLSREPGWASVRDKLLMRQLDASHALAGLAFGLSQGPNIPAQSCVAGLVLNQNGNGVTLSKELAATGLHSGSDLHPGQRGKGGRRLRLGIVHSASTHHFLIHSLLGRAGISREADVELIVLPPEQMPESLASGHLDGFCAGEPWNTVAASRGHGEVIATSHDLCSGHTEKVLLVTENFHETRRKEHRALIASLQAACDYCDSKKGRSQLVPILARPKYLDLPEDLLEDSLLGTQKDLHSFSGKGLNRPDKDKADLVLSQLRSCGLLPPESKSGSASAHGSSVFRPDFYDEAIASANPCTTLSSNTKSRTKKPSV